MTKRALRSGSSAHFAIPDAWVRRWRAAGGRVLGDLPGVEVTEPTILSQLPNSDGASVSQSDPPAGASSEPLRRCVVCDVELAGRATKWCAECRHLRGRR